MRIKKLPQAEQYTFRNRLRLMWRKVVQVMACIVVFCTTYALILPAITQESPIQCTVPEHVHETGCYDEAGEVLICELEEHSHSLACHSDPTADLEDATVWENSLAGANFTGIWQQDLVAVARTQLGYVESTRNYQVLADGITIQGYSRYGAWYGDPYGDWNGMFAAFCLRYAGVDRIPVEKDAGIWADALRASDLYRSQGAHVPEVGQLLFLDTNGDGREDRVGILTTVTGGTPMTLETIEGDCLNRVQSQSYTMDDPRILGYGLLPQQLTDQEWEQVEQVTEMIRALPTAEEVNETLSRYEAGEGDPEAYKQQVSQMVEQACTAYANLTVAQKAAVSNIGKLLALEFIRSGNEYVADINGVTSAAPTPDEFTSTRDFIELNLYDYLSGIQKRLEENPNYPGFYLTENGETPDFGNLFLTDSGIPAGTEAEYGELAPYLVEGYPALKDGSSLGYLFDGNDRYVVKKNTRWIDGLFLRDPVSGTYRYNSAENHAQYDLTDYDMDRDTDEFIRFDQTLTANFLKDPTGSFLPLNTITDPNQATQVGALNTTGGMRQYVEGLMAELEGSTDATHQQLMAMLQAYRENYPDDWETLTSAEAILAQGGNAGLLNQNYLDNLYNIDWDVATNRFFGMEMKLTFLQPRNGCIDSGDPMTFAFTGNEDVWVYIDGVLFLDLTGIPRQVSGRIDFAKGWVSYYRQSEALTGTMEEAPYAKFSFEQLLKAAGWTDEQIDRVLKSPDSFGNRPFRDYSSHSFRLYYLERSAGASAFRMEFNFPLLKEDSLTVAKEITTGQTPVLGDPDYYFNIVTPENTLFVGPNSVTGVETYKIQGRDGQILKNVDGTDRIFRTDAYGIFTLKAGQRAVFEGVGGNSAAYLVQELIRAEDKGQYPSTLVNDVPTGHNELIDWQYRTYFSGVEAPDPEIPLYMGPYGSQWYGRNGSQTIAGAEEVCFCFRSQADVTQLGALAITKKQDGTQQNASSDLEVTLDGQLLPVGTPYILILADGTELPQTVSRPGIVTLTPEETVQIHSILSGTAFTVRETQTGSTVMLTGSGAVMQNGSSLSGVIRTGQETSVVVTSIQQGAVVQIPVTAAVPNGPEEETYDVTYRLVPVTDATGMVETGQNILENILTMENGSGRFAFTVTYRKQDLTTLPATFYYRIDAHPGEGFLPTSDGIVAEVLVAEQEDGSITATLQRIHGSNTGTADFTHVLAGQLTLTNTVMGDEATMAQTFAFRVHLVRRSVILPREYTVLITDAEGMTTTRNMVLEGGDLVFENVPNGTRITRPGIPAMSRYTITVTMNEGLRASSRTNDQTTTGRTAEGNITNGETVVDYTNIKTYEIPETGGPGTILYTMAGCMLLLYCAAFLLYRYRKRGREVS